MTRVRRDGSVAVRGSPAGIAPVLLILASLCLACGGEQKPAPPAPRADTPGPAAAPAPTRKAPTPHAAAARKVPPKAARLPRIAPEVREKIQKVSDIPSEVEDPDEAVRQIHPWLQNPDREVREAAILALWDIENDSANRALAEVARTEKDPELKGYAVEELVDREAPQALEALLVVLENKDTDLREQAAEGLESLEDARASPGLYKRLEVEKDEWVRDAIISALATVDPKFDEDKYEE